MRCGLVAEIIAYRKSDDVDVRFEDGSELEGVSMRRFEKGTLAPAHYDLRCVHVGETLKMKCGLEATVVAYKSSHDVDIRFSDGTVRTSCEYGSFRKGILLPCKNYLTKKDRTGERAKMKCGLEAVIVRYRSSTDMDVEFSDGSLLTGAQYHSFMCRTLRPCLNRSIERIGEKRVMKCGLEAEVIAYRNANDIDLRFSDGRIHKNAAYHNFKNGRVSPSDQSEM